MSFTLFQHPSVHLFLVDLSAAFDIDDHSLLLNSIFSLVSGMPHCHGFHPTFPTVASLPLLFLIFLTSKCWSGITFKVFLCTTLVLSSASWSSILFASAFLGTISDPQRLFCFSSSLPSNCTPTPFVFCLLHAIDRWCSLKTHMLKPNPQDLGHDLVKVNAIRDLTFMETSDCFLSTSFM